MARSKHCKVCGICVSEFDHHCIWINGCVTRSNYALFVVFVGVHGLFMVYCASLFVLAVAGNIQDDLPLEKLEGFFDKMRS